MERQPLGKLQERLLGRPLELPRRLLGGLQRKLGRRLETLLGRLPETLRGRLWVRLLGRLRAEAD